MSRKPKKIANQDLKGEASPYSKAKAPQNSKAETLIALLQRKQGVSVAEMMSATGWQSHSVRGFMAGALKKKLGQAVTSTKTKSGERRYHLAA
jgi:hypothetical protein